MVSRRTFISLFSVFIIIPSRTEHLKIKSDCMYLLKKVSYEKQLTLSEFLEIEQYRFERLAVSSLSLSKSSFKFYFSFY